MTDTPCFATGKEVLPTSVWFRNSSLLICRGTPTQMVLEMIDSNEGLTVREALQRLVSYLEATHSIQIVLPWDQSEEILSTLFIKALLDLGIVEASPLA